jgi:hypothetical protein
LSFVDRVKSALTEYGVNAGSLTEQKVSSILNEFYEKIDRQLILLNGASNSLGANNVVNERIETGSGYHLHFFKGCFHRVPADWRIPRCGVHDLWRQWWIGDTERDIHPLKMVSLVDIKFVDEEPLTAVELARKVGPFRENRRVATNFLSDMRFLCNFITRIIMNLGKLAETITLSSVDSMFAVIAPLILDKERDAQKNWTSAVRELRNKELVAKIEAYEITS